MNITELLALVRDGELSVEQAEKLFHEISYEDIGFARLDHQRTARRGTGEVVYCAGKTPAQAGEIFEKLAEQAGAVLGTRATAGHWHAVCDRLPDCTFDEVGRTIVYRREAAEHFGQVAVCTGGTADIPVAEEAAVTAEFFGARVERVYDVGIAGIHRLLSKVDVLRGCNSIVTIAGMEGALAGVVAGLVECPVLSVPTSVGYGANFGGLSALLTMLNTCAEGVGVVNIDNGFGAGYLAAQINRMAVKGGPAK